MKKVEHNEPWQLSLEQLKRRKKKRAFPNQPQYLHSRSTTFEDNLVSFSWKENRGKTRRVHFQWHL